MVVIKIDDYQVPTFNDFISLITSLFSVFAFLDLNLG